MEFVELDDQRISQIKIHAADIWSHPERKKKFGKAVRKTIDGPLYGEISHKEKNAKFFQEILPYCKAFQFSSALTDKPTKFVSALVTGLKSGNGIHGGMSPLLAWLLDADYEEAERVYEDTGLLVEHGTVPPDRHLSDIGVMGSQRNGKPAKLLRPPATFKRERVQGDVEERVEELSKQFFGRSEQLDNLDRFVSQNDKGLLILAGQAGSGKSALLAQWLKRRAKMDNHLAYHFISNLKPSTTSPAIARANLLCQLEGILTYADKQPTADRRELDLDDALMDLVQTQRPLVIILDGLDEAILDEDGEPFAPFVDARDLRKGVYVVVSARQDNVDLQPAYLSRWQEQIDAGLPTLLVEAGAFWLKGLDCCEVAEWLTSLGLSRDPADIDELARLIDRATDGLPLFLTYVFHDLSEEFATLTSPKKRREFLRAIPQPFAKYLAEQISKIAKANKVTWPKSLLPFFAILSRMKGPISRDELGEFLGDNEPDWYNLDYSISRWLSYYDGDYSFAHPRLARAFAQVLGLSSDQVSDTIPSISKFVRDVEANFVAWMQENWGMRFSEPDAMFPTPYALEWLPEHLADRAESHQKQLASILASSEFLYTRLKQDPGRAFDRLHKHCNVWNDLSEEAKQIAGDAAWNAFWAENEGRLKSLSKRHLPSHLDRGFAESVAACLADSGVDSEFVKPFQKVREPSPLPNGALKRTILSPHDRWPSSITMHGNVLACWCSDGAVEFLDPGGGIIENADSSPSVSEHPLDPPTFWKTKMGYVSWTYGKPVTYRSGEGKITAIEDLGDIFITTLLDLHGSIVFSDIHGSLYFRSYEGSEVPGTGYIVDKKDDFLSHLSNSLRTLVAIGGGLIGFTHDGSIKFWDRAGQLLGEAPRKLPETLVPIGAKALKNTVLCWNEDGDLWLVDLRGRIVTDSVEKNAHSGEICGILETEAAYITWSDTGEIASWSIDGTIEQLWIVENAHQGSVQGVMLHLGVLVSWGADGRIRTLDQSGKLETRTSGYRAHVSGINSLVIFKSQLITSGDDGAIRFWDTDSLGQTPFRSVEKPICEAMIYDQKVIEWNGFGEINAWTLEGQEISSFCGKNAHDTWVLDVFASEDVFVSCSDDGAIRFWDKDGNRIEDKGDDQAHPDDCVNNIRAFGRGYISTGAAGTVRFSDENGRLLKYWESEEVHDDWIESIRFLKNKAITWSHQSGIAIWSHDGEYCEGADCRHPHDGGLLDVEVYDDYLISVGEDGVIKFWDEFGKCDHKPAITPSEGKKILNLWRQEDKFYTFGEDNLIKAWSNDFDFLFQFEHIHPLRGRHFRGPFFKFSGNFICTSGGNISGWKPDGAYIPSSDTENCHQYYIPKLVADTEVMISYSADGMIKIWDTELRLVEMLITPEAIGDILYHQGVLYAIGNRLWVYDIN